MKISLIQENLAKALIHINKAVNNRPTIPVLANVLIEAEKGRIKLSATNLEIGISTWIGAEVPTEGKLTVSARLISEFVNSLKPGKTEIAENNQMLEVNSVDNTAKFYIIPAEDFPKVPEAEGESILELNAFEFAEAIIKTTVASATDISRPVLSGILLESSEKQLTLVGVDGFRLSKKIIKVTKKGEKDIREIVPARSLVEVERLIKDVATEKDIVKIYLLAGKNQMLFKVGDVELSTRLIEGKFPDYQNIIPKDKVLTFKAKKNEFVNMIKIVSIFARNVVGNKAKFKTDIDNARLIVSANVADIGNNESAISVKDIEGQDFETGFNVKFLTDMVSIIEADQIVFESNGATAPGVFLDPDDKDFIHVIMPMRLE